MTRPGFIEAGLGAIREALETAADRAGLILRHYEPSKSAARRFRSTLARLETMLRRLLVLMAEQIAAEEERAAKSKTTVPHPEPVEGPEAAQPLSGTPSTNTHPSGNLHPDAIDVTLPLPRRRSFRLFGPQPATPEQLEILRALPRSANGGRDCTVSVPLLYRYRTLMRVLAEPDRHARRMARRLAAMGQSGDPAPRVERQPRLYQMPANLGLVAAILPDLTMRALRAFYDSG